MWLAYRLELNHRGFDPVIFSISASDIIIVTCMRDRYPGEKWQENSVNGFR